MDNKYWCASFTFFVFVFLHICFLIVYIHFFLVCIEQCPWKHCFYLLIVIILMAFHDSRCCRYFKGSVLLIFCYNDSVLYFQLYLMLHSISYLVLYSMIYLVIFKFSYIWYSSYWILYCISSFTICHFAFYIIFQTIFVLIYITYAISYYISDWYFTSYVNKDHDTSKAHGKVDPTDARPDPFSGGVRRLERSEGLDASFILLAPFSYLGVTGFRRRGPTSMRIKSLE